MPLQRRNIKHLQTINRQSGDLMEYNEDAEE